MPSGQLPSVQRIGKIKTYFHGQGAVIVTWNRRHANL